MDIGLTELLIIQTTALVFKSKVWTALSKTQFIAHRRLILVILINRRYLAEASSLHQVRRVKQIAVFQTEHRLAGV